MAMVVISFDGVEDKVFEKLAEEPERYPNIAKFKADSLYRGNIKTIFVSNTYPIHTTVATGKLPRDHGIISNFRDIDGQYRWAQFSKHIQAETIWDAASKKGLSTASILWPVTCGAKIKWNLPELHTHGKENHMVESLRLGSPWFQLKAFFKHGAKLRHFLRLSLDGFTTAVACDALRAHRPDLTLIHLLNYDLLCHRVGKGAKALAPALKSLDVNLGKILAAAGDAAVLLFSDHAHLDVSENIDLRPIFGENFLEQCGGSAFLKRQPAAGIERYPWFGRFLTQQELEESGFADRAACGVAAKPGYCFFLKPHKSNHGYPADYENYRVFYALRSTKFPADAAPEAAFGDVRDVSALISRELELNM